MTIRIPDPISLLDVTASGTRPKRTIREQTIMRRRSSVAFNELPHLEEGEHVGVLCMPHRKRRPGVGLLSSILAMARRHGPVDLTVLTFSIALASAEAIGEDPHIREVCWILDAGSEGRGNAGALRYIRERGDSLRLVRSHAKMAVLTADGFGLVITGSANLGKTTHWEQLDFVRSVDYAQRYLEMLDSIEEWRR